MKRQTLFFLLLAISFIGRGQINGYKYVYIPQLSYEDGSVDKFKIVSHTKELFEGIGFTAYTDTKTMPQELIDNICLFIRCEVNNTVQNWNGADGSYADYVSITMTIKDCDGNILFEGKSSTTVGNDMITVSQRGVDKIFKKKGGPDDYKYDPFLKNNKVKPMYNFPTVDRKEETEETLKTYFAANKLDPVEGIYKSFGTGQPNYKIGIRKYDGKLIAVMLESELSQWKPGDIKAYFEESAAVGIYSVNWYMGDKVPQQTIATLEKNAIITVNLTNKSNGQPVVVTLLKLFPANK